MPLRIVALILSWIVSAPAPLLDGRPVPVPKSLMIQAPTESSPISPSRREMTFESLIEDDESDDSDPLIAPCLPSLNAVPLIDRSIGASLVAGQSFASRARRPAILRC